MENENAFVTELFEKYHDQLKRYCMRYVRYNARYYPLTLRHIYGALFFYFFEFGTQ